VNHAYNKKVKNGKRVGWNLQGNAIFSSCHDIQKKALHASNTCKDNRISSQN